MCRAHHFPAKWQKRIGELVKSNGYTEWHTVRGKKGSLYLRRIDECVCRCEWMGQRSKGRERSVWASRACACTIFIVTAHRKLAVCVCVYVWRKWLLAMISMSKATEIPIEKHIHLHIYNTHTLQSETSVLWTEHNVNMHRPKCSFTLLLVQNQLLTHKTKATNYTTDSFVSSVI